MGKRLRLPPSRGWLASLAAVLVFVVAACEQHAREVNGVRPRTSAPCQSLVVPAYFYPGPEWTSAENGRPAPRIMIMDTAGPGAGGSPDMAYQSAVRQAQAAGITILGYSDTNYGRRPASAVEADVRKYRAWYGVTSIFLDRVASGTDRLQYYRALARVIHGAGRDSVVVLNPGTYPDPHYMSVGDIVVVFENTYSIYASLQVPGWVSRYPAARFAHIVYATAAGQLASALALAARRHAGYVYITDRSGKLRFGSLPSYWLREDALTARCATGMAGGARPGSS